MNGLTSCFSYYTFNTRAARGVLSILFYSDLHYVAYLAPHNYRKERLPYVKVIEQEKELV